MTTIPINEKYRIALDSHSWSIESPRKDKKAGGTRWAGVAWFPKLSQCYEWLLEQGLRESDIEGAAQVENVMRGLMQDLRECIEASPYCESWLDEKNRVAGGL